MKVLLVFSVLLVFDGSSYFVIPSEDWELQDSDTEIIDQSNNLDALVEKSGYLNDNLLKDV